MMLFAISVIFLIGVQDGSSLDQRNLVEGDRCVVKRTYAVGVCTPASSCQTTRNDYQINGIRPTFCSYNFDTILVCCTDNSNIFNSAGGWGYDNRRPVWGNFGATPSNNVRLSEKKRNLVEGDRCVVKRTNAVGVCTPASSCQTTMNDYQINGIRPKFCSYNFDTILVCCSDNSNIFNSAGGWGYDNRRPVWGNFGATPSNNVRLSEKKCEEYSRNVTQTVDYISLKVDPVKMTISAPKCDYNGVELIVGGENANQGEFPHMAALGWLDVEGNYVFHCGGSLISSRFVLTAGHCTSTPNNQLKNPEPHIVRLGDQNLDNNVRDNASPIDVPIKTIHKHPGYVSPSKYNDIALLELNADVDFEDNIRPACLWTKPDFPGYSKAIATGWGVADPQQPTKTSDELKKVSLSLLENDFCNVTLQDTFFRNWMGFSDDQLCAGELRGGQDTCQGDSGSPLQVASRSNKCIFHVIGVTSFGRACAKSGKPAIYTRVSSYLDWIEGLVWPGEQ